MSTPNEPRSFGLTDRIIGQIDRAIKVLWSPARTVRAVPADPADGPAGGSAGGPAGGPALEEAERRESCRLMRVNHAGEVSAQALYQGQALAARAGNVAEAMNRAADEEMDHLAWCEQRLAELGGRTSLLNPLWYFGSFAVGALAGFLGDRTSLGFISETEKQVESHLTDHLERLPAADARSRAILEQMRHDEIMHGATAASLGGAPLPAPLRAAMRLTSKGLTRGSYWL